MKAKIYLETTIPSYLASRESRNQVVVSHQRLTHQWWDLHRPAFQLFVSEPVLEECSAGDPALASRRMALLADVPILALTDEIIEANGKLLKNRPIPKNAAINALHIAIATSYACEYLLTWNCRHIANPKIQRSLRLIAKEYGLELPGIMTPEELMGSENEYER